jgi:hypothetical protein
MQPIRGLSVVIDFDERALTVRALHWLGNQLEGSALEKIPFLYRNVQTASCFTNRTEGFGALDDSI